MIIDTNFNVYSDAKEIDPDNSSPTLKRYHKLLWSKLLQVIHNLFYQSTDFNKYLFRA